MDNNTTEKFIKTNIAQEKTKSWDMRYYWLREQNTKKKLLTSLWKQSSDNPGDYHKKYFPSTHHQKVCMKYVRDYNSTKQIALNVQNFCK